MSGVATRDERAVEAALANAITSEQANGPATINDLTKQVFGEVSDEFVSGLISSVTLLRMAHQEVVGEQGAAFLVFLAGVRLGGKLRSRIVAEETSE